MKYNIPLYLLTVCLLAAAIYLRSPMIAISIVALWGVRAGEDVLTRKNKDSDIEELQTLIASHKVKIASLEHNIGNVAERARVILGENF